MDKLRDWRWKPGTWWRNAARQVEQSGEEANREPEEVSRRTEERQGRSDPDIGRQRKVSEVRCRVEDMSEDMSEGNDIEVEQKIEAYLSVARDFDGMGPKTSGDAGVWNQAGSGSEQKRKRDTEG